jgi:hypothetical protein
MYRVQKVSVHNVLLLRYTSQNNAHLPQVNSAFFDFTSLASEHYDSDTDFMDGLNNFAAQARLKAI